jgi:hypothetical protein
LKFTILSLILYCTLDASSRKAVSAGSVRSLCDFRNERERFRFDWNVSGFSIDMAVGWKLVIGFCRICESYLCYGFGTSGGMLGVMLPEVFDF